MDAHRRDVTLELPSMRRILVEATKSGATALWIGVVIWFVRTHAPSQLKPALEMSLRAQTDSLLVAWESKAPRHNPAVSVISENYSHEAHPFEWKPDRPVVITAGLSGSQTADTIDQAISRFGESQVTLRAEDRPKMYWAVFELLRRGYKPSKIQNLWTDKSVTSQTNSQLGIDTDLRFRPRR